VGGGFGGMFLWGGSKISFKGDGVEEKWPRKGRDMLSILGSSASKPKLVIKP